MKPRIDSISTTSALTDQLKEKSRRRRDDLGRAGQVSVRPTTRRNDLLPLLAITYVPLNELRSSKRKLRRLDAAHVREVASSIAALGFCAPLLIDKSNVVIDGEIRLEAAKLLGLGRAPCVRVDHLSDQEQRLLRLAVNRLGEKGQWDLEELKIEFEEMILTGAPIEISGFSLSEIDQVLIGDKAELESGPLAPELGSVAAARLGDVFQLGAHRLVCGDATNPAVLALLMDGDPPARLVLTDEPYNVKILGNVSGGAHREFAMASGEMSDAEFLAFNSAWIGAAVDQLRDGGVFGTFIDWRGLPIVHAAATKLCLTPLNLVVWAKTNQRTASNASSETPAPISYM